MPNAPKVENGLTLKQSAFVEAYLGAGHGALAESAKLAGYVGKDKRSLHAIGGELLRKPHVAEAIRRRRGEMVRVNCLSRFELMDKMTAIVLDPAAKPMERIRAADVLCKMEGYYSETRIVEGKVEMSFAAQREQLRALLLDENVIQAADVIATAAEGVEA